MLKKLRRQFILLNMITVSVVLVALSIVICAVTYQQDVSSVYDSLDSALERAESGMSQGDDNFDPEAISSSDDGIEPGLNPDGTAPNGDNADPNDPESVEPPASEPSSSSPVPPAIGGNPGGRDDLSLVAVYQVMVGSDAYEALSEFATASMDDDVVAEAISELSDESDGHGCLNSLGLYYTKQTVGDMIYFAFADTSEANGWQQLAVVLAAVDVGAFIVFLIISIFFARWALRPVEEAWTRQRQFIADASHELKTPLTVILANSAILRESPSSTIAEQSQWIESTHTEAERMQHLVLDMLTLARGDAEEISNMGSAQAEKEIVDLSNLVEGECLQFESVAFDRGILIDSDVTDGLQVEGDEKKLQRLCGTLLDNACKYGNENGRITVVLKRSGKDAILSVQNTGTPIDPEDLEHLFDRFYRADKARTREGSYGLGLSIAKQIVDEMHGDISVASTAEAGTTFTVTLPLGK